MIIWKNNKTGAYVAISGDIDHLVVDFCSGIRCPSDGSMHAPPTITLPLDKALDIANAIKIAAEPIMALKAIPFGDA